MSTRWSRRSFLGRAIASGAILELPFLGRAGAAPAPLNFVTIFVPDGIIPSLWFPKGSETNFTLPAMADPLNAVKSDCIFFEGLAMHGGEPSHPGGTKKVLTATGAMSLDVFLGQKLKGSLPFDSVQLGVASNFENGSGTISFIGAGQEVKPDDNPLNVFDRLFAGHTPASTTDPAAQLKQRQKQSVLDAIHGDLTALQAKLGSTERARLDTHLQALRDVEMRASGAAMPGGGMGCDAGGFNKQGYKNVDMYYPQTYDKVENFPVVGQLQQDLLMLALSCNLTRVVTLMWSHAVSPTKIASNTTGNHDSSHYGTDPMSANARQFVNGRRWFMTQLATLLQRMKSTTYGDGNLLDHTAVLLCSDIGDGDLHEHRSLPFMLAGGAKAGWKTGRYLNYTGMGMGGMNETHAKLLVSIARGVGVNVDSFGYTAMGTGGLPRL
jgi:hypothetical protein